MSEIKIVGTCRYCGSELEHTGGPLGVWIHRSGRSMFCDVELVGRDDVKGSPE